MTTTTSAVRAEMTVNEIIAAFPASVSVFRAWGIDACCGGALPLDIVAERHGHDLSRLLDELNRATEA